MKISNVLILYICYSTFVDLVNLVINIKQFANMKCNGYDDAPSLFKDRLIAVKSKCYAFQTFKCTIKNIKQYINNAKNKNVNIDKGKLNKNLMYKLTYK